MKEFFKKSFVSILISLALILNLTPTAKAHPSFTVIQQDEIETAISSGFDYLLTQINDDGGIRWIDENSSLATTLRVVQALAAAGYQQNALKSETGRHPIDYLQKNAHAWVYQEASDNPGFSVARAGQMLTAVAAANENPNRFGPEEVDLVREINLRYDPPSGVFGSSTPDNVMDQVWAMIGLAANNASVPEEAASWLVSVQAEDGSWNDGFGSTLDTTPLGILALLSSQSYTAESRSIQSAINFMMANQQPSGGWQYEWDTTTNANTTAVMLQAINLLGQYPTDELWRQANGSPVAALLDLQGENGAIGGEFANAYSTADALIALAGKSITDLGALEIASNGFDFIFSLQESNGGWGTVGQTIDVLLALNAAGWHPNTITADQAAPLDYLGENLEIYLESGPDAIGKAILGLIAAGEDPHNFNGKNLVERLMASYDEATGAFGDPENTWHQSLGILGMYASDSKIPEGAVDTLLTLQQEDGGWEYTPGFGPKPDNTALAIQALLAAGLDPQDPAISSAIETLYAMQTPDGGWGDSSTTAFVIMAIHALGQSEQEWIANTGKGPISELLSFQKANGSFVYNWDFPDDNLMSTSTALFALFEGSYLIKQNPKDAANHAAILVDIGEGTRFADCVELSAETITGLDLMEQSDFTYSIQEGFLNSIMGISNPEGETNYWSYWTWNGREWVFRESGADASTVYSGTVDAWYFTSWEDFPSFPPNMIPDIDQICGKDVLKNYAAQSFLDYNDLFEVSSQQFQPIKETRNEPAESRSATPTDSEEINPQMGMKSTPNLEATPFIDDEVHTDLPLIIIAGVGGMVLLLVVLILFKNRK